jgi:transcriptional regulator with XRE-family HTH domain
MHTDSISLLYKDFGAQVRKHRERLEFTQEELGLQIGLSRTSITNIERGRQHMALHQIFEISRVLKIPPSTLLPRGIWDGDSWLAEKLPPGTASDITDWAKNLR